MPLSHLRLPALRRALPYAAAAAAVGLVVVIFSYADTPQTALVHGFMRTVL